MTELIEAVARVLCKAGGFDPDEMMPNDGPRWRYYVPSVTAITDAGYRIVKDEPQGWRYGRDAHTSIIRTYRDPHLVGDGWTETPLYAAPEKS